MMLLLLPQPARDDPAGAAIADTAPAHHCRCHLTVTALACHHRCCCRHLLVPIYCPKQVHIAERLGVPLHCLLTIPWLPTNAFPHPWARAFDKNIVEWVNEAAAAALVGPVCKLVGYVKPAWASRFREWALSGIAAAANKLSAPLLDHTAW